MKRVSESFRSAHLAAAAAVSLILAGCGGGGGSGGGGGGAAGDGGAGGDTTPPAIVSVTPAAGAANVALNGAVTVSFSEEVDCATVATTSFTLAAGVTPVSGSVTCSGSTATFTPSASLAPSTTHTATVTAAVKDRAGNALEQPRIWSFVTDAAALDVTPPEVVGITPASGATNVALNGAVTVSFSEEVDCATVTTTSFTLAAGLAPVSGSVACSGSSATLAPSASLAPSTTHVATVTAAVKDRAGNALAQPRIWSFVTDAAALDRTAPEVLAITPAAGATNVPVDVVVSVTFSEAVDCATVTASGLALATAGGRVDGRVACSGATATFTPSAPLAGDVRHTATVSATDLAGNAMGSVLWSFTTGAAPDTTRPEVVAFSPAAGATNVPVDAVVAVTFSEAVDCATLTTTSFTLATGGGRVDGRVACSGATATFTPSAPLAGEVRHTVTVSASDLAGNAMGSMGWSFTTGAAPDTTPPTVATVTPAAGLTEVATSTAVQISFGELVDCRTLTTATFTLETAAGSPIAATVTCSGSHATLQPSAPLARATEHVATAAAGVTDVAGNALGAAYTWRFTTQAGAWSVATRLDSGVGEVDSFRFAVNAAGAAAAVWVQTDAANQKHLWWAGFDPATGWTAPEAAESLTGNAFQPAIAIDANGHSLVAWTHTDASGSAVWTRVRTADGTWGGPLKLWGDSASLGVDGAGNVICVWRHDDGARTNVWATRYPLGPKGLGGAWEAAVLIEADDSRTALTRPSVAVSSNGDATAVWGFYSAATQHVVTANRYSAASGTWGTPVDLSLASSKSALDPTVVMDDAGEAVALWRQEYLNGWSYVTVISTARFTSTGWSPASQFDWVDGLLAQAPSVAGNGTGDVQVVWSVGTCGPVVQRRYAAGTGWERQAALATSSCADRPAVALAPTGDAIVAWGERTSGTDSVLEAARYIASTATWDPRAALVGAETAAMLPALAADASGGVTALWLQWNGTRHNLLASRFE